MAHMGDIYGETVRDFEAGIRRDWQRVEHVAVSLIPHHGGDPYAASQTPAAQPVNVDTTAPQENAMDLSKIKDAAENADQWVKTVLEQHLPELEAEAAKYGSPTVVRIAETLAGRVLPQPYEDMAVAVLEALFDKHGTTAPVEQPQQPAAA